MLFKKDRENSSITGWWTSKNYKQSKNHSRLNTYCQKCRRWLNQKKKNTDKIKKAAYRMNHLEKHLVLTIMSTNNFSGKGAIQGNGVFGEMIFGEPTFTEKQHNRWKYRNCRNSLEHFLTRSLRNLRHEWHCYWKFNENFDKNTWKNIEKVSWLIAAKFVWIISGKFAFICVVCVHESEWS